MPPRLDPAPLPRTAGTLRAGLVACVALAACGEVHFVPNPYLARDIEITYSRQEDLTVFAWRLGENVDPDRVRFEYVRAGAWVPLEFDAAPYPAGSWDCGAATCWRWTLPGRYEPPADGRFLRSIHSDHGVLTASKPAYRTVDVTLALAPRFRPDNRRMALRIDDLLAPPESPLRRSFQWRVEVSPSGCPVSVGAFDGETRQVETVDVPRQPVVDPTWCATIRPVARHGFAPVTVQADGIPAHPELEVHEKLYVPESVSAPTLVQVIFNLEIPSEERCAQSLAQFETIVDAEFAKRDPGYHRFSSMNAAVDGAHPCRQRLDGTFDSGGAVNEIRSYVNASVPQSHGARTVAIYAQNLALDPFPQVRQELDRFVMQVGNDWRAGLVGFFFTPPGGLGNAYGFEQTAWTSPRTPAFVDVVKQWAEKNLPFRSMLHDVWTRVPFVENDMRPLPGREYRAKKCVATPDVQLFVGDAPLPPEAATAPIADAIPDLSFGVDLGVQDRVPFTTYVENQVSLTFELCRRFCAHPFETAGGEWIASPWQDVATCRGEE